jgi:hypothetical protein
VPEYSGSARLLRAATRDMSRVTVRSPDALVVACARRVTALADAANSVSSTWLYYFLLIPFAPLILGDVWLEERAKRHS